MWIVMAALSAVFAGFTAIFAKSGIKKTDSDVATALRTVVVAIFSWAMVFIVGSANTIKTIDVKSFVFLIFSGLSTGASWLCYFRALSMADINQVAPIDKSSTILTVLVAIVLFGETNHLSVKLLGIILMTVGIFLMIEKKHTMLLIPQKGWLIYAFLSAILASATSILAKIGISDVESNLGTAIRTCVVLLMAWIIVLAKGKQRELKKIDKKEFGYITLSGIATGASWLCYFYALQNGIVSVVVPIDKLSVLITVIFGAVFFNEKLQPKAIIGLILMVTGVLAMSIWA